MRKHTIKAVIVIFIGLLLGSVIWGLYAFLTWDKHRMDDFDQQDLQALEKISELVFEYMDKEAISPSSDELSNEGLEEIFGDYYEGIVGIYYVEEDIIFISYGVFFQSVDGMVFEKKKLNLKDTYDFLGYDPGTITYEKMSDHVYRYRAGV